MRFRLSSSLCHYLLALLAALAVVSPVKAAQSQPNIVWINVEDMSPHWSCYGETTIQTPNIDRLAAEGARFSRAFVTCPVCSPSRSALITGMYQTTIGAHQHRSGRGALKIDLPSHVRLIPDLFREAGYFVTNGGKLGQNRGNSRQNRIGKTDYNFRFRNDLYDGNDWRGRKPGQPFFAQIQLSGGKGRTDKTPKPIAPADVNLPPYYPNDEVIRKDWARYLNAVMNTDVAVGQIVERLADEGVLENTYIFLFTDHGISHARGKQFLYEEGIHIPLIVRGPGIEAGTQRDDLVAHIDLAASSLALAGIEMPGYLQSRPLFGPSAKPRQFVVSARDRCDETVDRIRSVRTKRYKYIRNFHPQRPYLQPNAYKDKKEIIVAIRRLYAEGKLNRDQSLIMAATRPAEELYDLKADPLELHNLAGLAEHAETLERLRGILDRWIQLSGDRGEIPESEAMYDSDMKLYVDGMNSKGGSWIAHAARIEANIRQMKQWVEKVSGTVMVD